MVERSNPEHQRRIENVCRYLEAMPVFRLLGFRVGTASFGRVERGFPAAIVGALADFAAGAACATAREDEAPLASIAYSMSMLAPSSRAAASYRSAGPTCS